MQILYNVTDTIIISYALGQEGVSAANNGGQIINVIINIVNGLALGGTVLIGQQKGSKDSSETSKTIGTFLSLMTLIGFFVTLIFIIFSKTILVYLNTPQEVMKDANAFLRIYSFAIIFIFGFNSISAIFRGIGNSLMPFVFVSFSVIVNIVLDLLFVFILGFGIEGAAWATTISIILSFVMSIVYLKTQKDIFLFEIINFKIIFNLAKKILLVGVPSGIQSSIFGLSILIVTSFVNKYGVTASATIGIGSKIDSIFLLPLIAISGASAAMVAQNIGAKQMDRVKETILTALTYNVALASFFFAIAQLFPSYLFRIFTKNAEVIELGISYMRWVSFNYLFIAFLQTFNSLAIGVGNTIYALCTTIMNGFVFRVPISYIFENFFGLGLVGVFIGLGFANIGGSLAGFIYYKIGYWKKFKL